MVRGFLQKCDIVTYLGASYRVLFVYENEVLLIELDTIKTNILLANKCAIEANILDGIAELKEKEEKDNIRYINPECLSGKSLDIYKQYRNVSEAFWGYSLSYDWLLNKEEKAIFIKKIAADNNISPATARRRLREFLQNGMTLRGLEPKYYNCGAKGKERSFAKGLRPGKRGFSQVVRDQETIAIFDKMTRRLVMSKGQKTMTTVYYEMVQEFYSEKRVVNGETDYISYSAVARPTLRQLRYHINKQIGPVEKYAMVNGFKKTRNNIRPLTSDTINALSIKTIGCAYEMDEMETDYELVDSYDRNKVIGRGIMYMIKDVFSKMIVGYAVGIENNSWAGAEMALLNMVEDKVEYCRRRGIEIVHEDWPVSKVMPEELTFDNGAEYISKMMEEYSRAIDLHISFTPAASGSMKGNIESEFRQFNLKTNGLLPGQIIKNSYGKQHERSARLTMEEFDKIVLRFILYHNKTPMKNYKSTKKLFDAGVVLSPNEIWKYCLQENNCLRKVDNIDSYRLALLCDERARITREGIVYKNIIYEALGTDGLLYEMGRAALEGSKKVNIKYDKRCMDIIFYQTDDGTYEKAVINPKKTTNELYYGLSHQALVALNREIKRRNLSWDEIICANSVQLVAEIKNIVRDSMKKHVGRNSNKNKRENRELAKMRIGNTDNVVSTISFGEDERFITMKETSTGRRESEIERREKEMLLEWFSEND